MLLDRPADPHLQILVGRHRRIEIHDDAPARDERPVEHQPERALLFAVRAQQDDRPVEIRIRELRHRQEQRGSERTSHFYDDNALSDSIQELRNESLSFQCLSSSVPTWLAF